MFSSYNDSEDENRVNVKYIALGSRSMVELSVNLKKVAETANENEERDDSDHSDHGEGIP